MSQRIHLTTKSRAIRGWVLGKYSSVPFLASVPVCISWVIRGTRWVSVMRHQWEEQPRETTFFHLARDANKAKDELAADGSKALKVEIAIHSSLQWDRRRDSCLCLHHFHFSLFPSASLSWSVLLKEGLKKLCSRPHYPEARLPGILSKKL